MCGNCGAGNACAGGASQPAPVRVPVAVPHSPRWGPAWTALSAAVCGLSRCRITRARAVRVHGGVRLDVSNIRRLRDNDGDVRWVRGGEILCRRRRAAGALHLLGWVLLWCWRRHGVRGHGRFVRELRRGGFVRGKRGRASGLHVLIGVRLILRDIKQLRYHHLDLRIL